MVSKINLSTPQHLDEGPTTSSAATKSILKVDSSRKPSNRKKTPSSRVYNAIFKTDENPCSLEIQNDKDSISPSIKKLRFDEIIHYSPDPVKAIEVNCPLDEQFNIEINDDIAVGNAHSSTMVN